MFFNYYIRGDNRKCTMFYLFEFWKWIGKYYLSITRYTLDISPVYVKAHETTYIWLQS